LNVRLVTFTGRIQATVTLSITNHSTPESDEIFGFIVQPNTSDPLTRAIY